MNALDDERYFGLGAFAISGQNRALYAGAGGKKSTGSPSADPFLLKSTDGGVSWAEMPSLGLSPPSSGEPVNTITTLVGTQDGVLYAGTNQGLRQSLDGAQTWAEIDHGQGAHIIDIAVDPTDSRSLYVIREEPGLASSKLRKSEDGGLTWRSLDTGIRVLLHRIVVHPKQPATLYVAYAAPTDSPLALDPERRAGVMESRDGGASWLPVNSGLTSRGIVGLTNSPLRVSAAMAVSTAEPGSVYFPTLGGLFRLNRNGSVVWWASSTSGQGMVLSQTGNTLWGQWHSYDESGADTWVNFQGQLVGHRMESDLWRFTGPALGQPWNINQVRGESVGELTLDLSSSTAVIFSYTRNGVSGTLPIQPFEPNAKGPYNGVWWDPVKSGQDVVLVQTGDSLQGIWYAYDESGTDLWAVFGGAIVGDMLSADLLRYRGPALGQTWIPGEVQSTPVGTVTLKLLSERRIEMDFVLDGVGDTLHLESFSR
ncbi:MAG: hypothetical protein U1F68_15790 [Gammaproteobacteria bacterium]